MTKHVASGIERMVSYFGMRYAVEESHTERVRRWPRLPWPKRTVTVIDRARLLSVAPLPKEEQ